MSLLLENVRKSYREPSGNRLPVLGIARYELAQGEQAALVLSTVKREGLEARGEEWTEEAQHEFEDGIRDQYEVQGNPYYASARLWDDGVIDPAETRHVLSLALSAAMNRPRDGDGTHGIFRM